MCERDQVVVHENNKTSAMLNKGKIWREGGDNAGKRVQGRERTVRERKLRE